jgi:hypothetical protein
VFEDYREKLDGRLRDLVNHTDEMEDRIGTMEKQITGQLKSSSKNITADANLNRGNSFMIPQIPDMESIHKKIGDLESYIDSLRGNIRTMELKFTADLNELRVKKGEKIIQEDNTADIKTLKQKFFEIDQIVHNNQDSLLSRIIEIEDKRLPFLGKIIKLHMHQDFDFIFIKHVIFR